MPHRTEMRVGPLLAVYTQKFPHPNPSVKHWMGMGSGKCMGNCPIHLVNSYGIFVGKYIIPIHSHWVLTQRMWVLKGWCSRFISDDLFASLKIKWLKKNNFPKVKVDQHIGWLPFSTCGNLWPLIWNCLSGTGYFIPFFQNSQKNTHATWDRITVHQSIAIFHMNWS